MRSNSEVADIATFWKSPSVIDVAAHSFDASSDFFAAASLFPIAAST
jgi:hypothetical protein